MICSHMIQDSCRARNGTILLSPSRPTRLNILDSKADEQSSTVVGDGVSQTSIATDAPFLLSTLTTLISTFSDSSQTTTFSALDSSSLQSLASSLMSAESVRVTSSQTTTLQTSVTQPTIYPTAINSAPQITSQIDATALSTAAASTSFNPDTWGTTQCQENANCTSQTQHEEHRRGVLVGSVVGVVALGVFVFALVMCFRCIKKRKKVVGESEPVHTNEISDINNEKTELSPLKPIASALSIHELDGPGPAVESFRPARSWYLPDPIYTSDEALASSRRNNSDVSDPFKTPVEDEGHHTNRSLTGAHPNASQIGLALSRYSNSISEQVNKKLKDSAPCALMQDSLHKRASSISAASTSGGQDSDILYIGRARTARRHSFSPRIVNIIAHQKDDYSDGNFGMSLSHGKPNSTSLRGSIRARSVSPVRKSSRYTGSPVKLVRHFGIEAWSLNSGRELIQNQQKPNPQRDTAVHGNGQGNMITSQCINYPQLGRTMSQVKKNIKERGESAFMDDGQTSFRQSAERKVL